MATITLTSPTGRTISYDPDCRRLIDYTPHVLEALKNGPMTTTQLRTAVWGTSGSSSQTLQALIIVLTDRGFVNKKQRGHACIYSLP